MKKRQIPTGVLVWLALTLLVLVVFLTNRERINQVLEVTGFVEIVQENWEVKEPELHPTYLEDSTYNPDLEADEELPFSEEPEVVLPEPDTETPAPEEEENLRKVRLYFIKVNNDGEIMLRSTLRGIAFGNSPLTATLKSLLTGTSPEETNQGLISLIPQDSQLLSVSVQNGTAVINFSEEFQFNQIGIAGYEAQLKQIVYTATEFDTVEQVQFLIENRKVPYLGAEGLYIGEPLRREVFE